MLNTVAFDLGSYTIKAIQAKKQKPLVVDRTIEVFNTTGLTLAVDDASTEKLSQLIATVFQDHALAKTDVRIALAENLVSTKIISIPVLTDAELASAINWQAEQHIPIPLEELSLEYQVVYRPPKGSKTDQMRVLMVGVRKSIVDKYLEIFLRNGIEPTLLETQVLAIFRSMQFTTEDSTTLVVHMGASTTDMFVVSGGELRFVYTHGSGGQILTRTIEQAVQLDAKQAEQYKRSYGIDPQQLNGKMREVLMPALQVSIMEMQKAIQFFVSQQQGEQVKRVLLSGGAAQLPGLVQLITEKLGVEVLVAAPFTGATGDIPAGNHPAFSACVGLLGRSIL